jgi:hypothetical protein
MGAICPFPPLHRNDISIIKEIKKNKSRMGRRGLPFITAEHGADFRALAPWGHMPYNDGALTGKGASAWTGLFRPLTALDMRGIL